MQEKLLPDEKAEPREAYARYAVGISACKRALPSSALTPPERIPFTSELEKWAQAIMNPPRVMVIQLAEVNYLDVITSQMVEAVLCTVQAILAKKKCKVLFVNMPNALARRFEAGKEWFCTIEEALQALQSLERTDTSGVIEPK